MLILTRFCVKIFKRAYLDSDPVALSILDSEVDEFVKYIASVTNRLQGSFEHKIILSGGLIENSAGYRNAIIRKLSSICPGWSVEQAEDGAAVKGCLKLASR